MIEGIEWQARREALGMSQTEMANYLGVSQVTVSRWETGERRISPGAINDLRHLESRFEQLIELMVETGTAAIETGTVRDGVLMLETFASDQAMWAARPDMDGIPSVVHRIACAHAVAEIGESVRIGLADLF